MAPAPLDLAALEAGLEHIRQAPTGEGRVVMIVRRPADNEREALDEARIDEAGGVVGDVWVGESGDTEAQVTVMNVRATALVAQSRDRWQLAGDQIYVDFDLSPEHAPPGTRLAVGTAVLEVSAKPHRGCKKFAARFGVDALRFVNSPEGRALNLRGINTRVVSGGVVRPGDPIRKLAG
ncbi:MAG: MOSC domain-containing protein [Micromonosporaceae bacterium]|nr:MOSC domain-containing protein [Micromonosporaceae bacterium]